LNEYWATRGFCVEFEDELPQPMKQSAEAIATLKAIIFIWKLRQGAKLYNAMTFFMVDI
jgi:hypothetical protein